MLIDTGSGEIQKRTATIGTIVISKEPFNDAGSMKGFFTEAMPHQLIPRQVGFKTNETLGGCIHTVFGQGFIGTVILVE
jgi:hypothetical protein